MGYYRAGFEVTGVDIVPQPNYPFAFHQADALTFDCSDFDVIHVSPPCQGYSLATSFHRGARQKHPLLIETFRELLKKTGKPYVIENVERAKKHMDSYILLCGEMFGLKTYRHRVFESNMQLVAPEHPKHRVKSANPGAIPKEDEYWCVGGHFGQKDRAQREALGIDWMKTVSEIANAIPPVYSQCIGIQIMHILLNEIDMEKIA